MWFPTTPGWGPLVLMVGGPSPFLAEDPGCGSPPLLAVVRRPRWWWWLVSWGLAEGFPVLCVFVVRAGVRGARAVVCFVCFWCLC